MTRGNFWLAVKVGFFLRIFFRKTFEKEKRKKKMSSVFLFRNLPLSSLSLSSLSSSLSLSLSSSSLPSHSSSLSFSSLSSPTKSLLSQTSLSSSSLLFQKRLLSSSLSPSSLSPSSLSNFSLSPSPLSPSSLSCCFYSSQNTAPNPGARLSDERLEKMLRKAENHVRNEEYSKGKEILEDLLVFTKEEKEVREGVKSSILLLGYTLHMMDQRPLALSYYSRGLGLLEDNDEQRSWATLNYAECLAETGDEKKAAEVCEEVLPLVKKIHGDDSDYYAAALGNVAAYFGSTGQYEKAVGFAKDGYIILDQRLGKQNEYTQGVYKNYLKLLTLTERREEAESLVAEWKRGGGPDLKDEDEEIGEALGLNVPSDDILKSNSDSDRLASMMNHANAHSQGKMSEEEIDKTRKITENQLQDFLEAWKKSGHEVHPEVEKQMWEMCKSGGLKVDENEKPPTPEEVDQIISKAQRTGAITRSQAKSLKEYYKGKDVLFGDINVVDDENAQNNYNVNEWGEEERDSREEEELEDWGEEDDEEDWSNETEEEIRRKEANYTEEYDDDFEDDDEQEGDTFGGFSEEELQHMEAQMEKGGDFSGIRDTIRQRAQQNSGGVVDDFDDFEELEDGAGKRDDDDVFEEKSK